MPSRRAMLLALLAPALLPAGEVSPAVAAREVLQSSCIECHGPAKAKGKLRLDSREAILAGGREGPAVVPGEPERSPLLARVLSHDPDERMPEKQPPLPAAQVAALRAWIAAGAPWEAPQPGDFWSFRALAQPAQPAGDAWCRTPIDRFVRAALQAKGLAPSAEADRRILVRRVTWDLTGLPPTPAEVDAFVADRGADAYERLVDRLLASPRHGERWARHWLDVARYADSDGYESDYDRPDMWPYRDWVVRALNEDLPFDRFVRFQLAGDEDPDARPGDLAGLGFLAAGPVSVMVNATPTDRAKLRYEELDDLVSTVGSAFLGLTIGCARCHDHKYDPVSQADYYRLLAAFADTRRERRHLAPAAEVAAWEKRRDAVKRDGRLHAAQQALKDFLAGLRDPQAAKIAKLKIDEDAKTLLRLPIDPDDLEQTRLRDLHADAISVPDGDFSERLEGANAARWRELGAAVRAVLAEIGPPPPAVLAVVDAKREPTRTPLLKRGMVETPGEALTLGVPAVLNRGGAHPHLTPGAAASGQRLAVARWLVDRDRGAGALAARVIVNRIWQHHVGEGLVRTPNDFGLQGERPTHPELLEHLAHELVAGGWRLKPIHRQIVLSATYRQASLRDPAKAAVDGDDRLLWRMPPRRLEAEALRDGILAVSGGLDARMFGPPVRLPIPASQLASTTKSPYPRGIADGPALWRRSIYAFVKRSASVPFFDVFDRPMSSASCGRRTRAAVPTQALLLMNDPFVRTQAELLAKRMAEAGADPAARVERGFRLAFGRAPGAAERDAVLAVARSGGDGAWRDIALVLLQANEFAIID